RHDRQDHRLGRHACARRYGLARVHAERAQSRSARARCHASFRTGCAQREAWLRDSAEARSQAGGASPDRPRRQVAAQSLRSQLHPRGTYGAKASTQALLLADPAVSVGADAPSAQASETRLVWSIAIYHLRYIPAINRPSTIPIATTA